MKGCSLHFALLLAPGADMTEGNKVGSGTIDEPTVQGREKTRQKQLDPRYLGAILSALGN